MDTPREERLQFMKHFGHAQGWLLLDQVAEAARSLARIPAAWRERPEVLTLRMQVHLSAGEWREAVPLGRRLLDGEPHEPGHWISLAYAVRRADSLPAAESILREAGRRFPDCALIWFNLACYSAQQARLPEARTLLAEAFRLDATLRDQARTDPDLAALHGEMATEGGPASPERR